MRPTLRITVLDTDAQTTRVEEFSRSPVRVGRHPNNELVLNVPVVSAWHAEVHFDATSARLVDLRSSNGIEIDGELLSPGDRRAIADALRVRIGPIELNMEWFGARGREQQSVRGAVDSDAEPAKGESGTQAIPLHRLHALIRQLRGLHEQMERSRRTFDAAYEAAIAEFRDQQAPHAVTLLREAFPGRDAAPSAAEGPPGLHEHTEHPFEQAELGEIARLAGSIGPGFPRPVNLADARRFLQEIVQMLRIFAGSLVDLHEARVQQSEALGLAAVTRDNPLVADGLDEREVLTALLDGRKDVTTRVESLRDAVTVLLAHQRGLMQGAIRGCRYLVERLAPADIERGVEASWLTRAAALWHSFEKRYEALVGDPVAGIPPGLRRHIADGYQHELAKVGVVLQAKKEAVP